MLEFYLPSTDLDGRVNYGHLFSMELPKTVMSMDVNLTQGTSCLPPSKIVQVMSTMLVEARPGDVFKSEGMMHLRNVAFPIGLHEKDIPTFCNESDLGKVLPSTRNRSLAFSLNCNGYAIRSRFVGLPIHKICYYQSYEVDETVATRQLRDELDQYNDFPAQDCIDMTPLHILACSTKQRIEMYTVLIRRHPEYLIIEDSWGDVPLLYLFWGRAPSDIVLVVCEMMKQLHPNYKVNWGKMIETLCLANAPISCIEYLIETGINSFEDDTALCMVDWEKMVDILCSKAKASEDQVHNFIKTYTTYFPHRKSHLQMCVAQMVRREKFGFQKFWLRVSISSQLASLEKLEWRNEIESLLENCPTGNSGRHLNERIKVMNTVYHKLGVYEVYGLMTMLELALWKARLDTFNDTERVEEDWRHHCRITSGAALIVPEVVAYLLPQKQTH